MPSKVVFAERAQRAAGALAVAVDECEMLVELYADRGYAAGGADPITDPQIPDLGMTAVQLANFMTLAGQLVTYLDSAGGGGEKRRATLAKVRKDV